MEIDIIGVPMDCGASRRGVDMGPSAIRYAGLYEGLSGLGHSVKDRGNIAVPPSETLTPGSQRLKYLDAIIPVTRTLAEHVSASTADGRITLVLGGDHSVALGSIIGASHGGRGRRLGLVWLDAHGDFNTEETTPSGNVHGMPLAALLGYGDRRLVTLDGRYEAGAHVDPAHVAVVAARDLDPRERVLMRESGIHVFSMEAIDRLGIAEVMQRAIETVGVDGGTDGIHISFDIDAVDPRDAPGVGTPSPGGLTFREAHLAMEMLAETGSITGMDMVEVNPILDRGNATAELALQLILSAFGKRIWG